MSAPLTSTDGGDGGDFTLAVSGATSGARGVVKLANQLGGSADAPDVRGVRVTDATNPVFLTIGEVLTGQALVRSGEALVGASVVPQAGGTMSGDLIMGGNKVTGLASGSGASDAATYGQLVAMLNGLDWQQSVLDKDVTDPSTINPPPSAGDRYVIVGTGQGDWANQTGKIAERTGSGWTFTAPNKGMTVHVEDQGIDLSYNGTAWVNIGASVDHAALLGRDASDAHTQYQLTSGKDQNDGYAGLDSEGLPIKPGRKLRTIADPGSPASGEVWINGPDLKYQDGQGSPALQVVERRSRRNQANGYAGLDGVGRLAAAQAPVKATYSTGGDQALAPADIGAVAPARAVNAGAGMAGGGDLSADRTLSIGSFSGLVAKDVDPDTASWGDSEVKVHATIDVGDGGHLVPVAVRLPAAVNDDLETEVVFEFGDGASNPVIIANAATGAVLDLDFAALSLTLMGNLTQGPANNGRRVRKIILRTRNTTTNTPSNVDIGVFRVRAYAFPRGGGAAL
ncbi:MAG: DUF2793 domain-containing protein [Myxococcota bacterium]